MAFTTKIALIISLMASPIYSFANTDNSQPDGMILKIHRAIVLDDLFVRPVMQSSIGKAVSTGNSGKLSVSVDLGFEQSGVLNQHAVIKQENIDWDNLPASFQTDHAIYLPSKLTIHNGRTIRVCFIFKDSEVDERRSRCCVELPFRPSQGNIQLAQLLDFGAIDYTMTPVKLQPFDSNTVREKDWLVMMQQRMHRPIHPETETPEKFLRWEITQESADGLTSLSKFGDAIKTTAAHRSLLTDGDSFDGKPSIIEPGLLSDYGFLVMKEMPERLAITVTGLRTTYAAYYGTRFSYWDRDLADYELPIHELMASPSSYTYSPTGSEFSLTLSLLIARVQQ